MSNLENIIIADALENQSVKKVVNIDGTPVELEITQTQEKGGVSFSSWLLVTKNPTPYAAWQYKQGEIECLIAEWNDSVLFGKDQLKKSIDSIKLLNDKLNGENTQLRKEIANLSQEGNNFT